MTIDIDTSSVNRPPRPLLARVAESAFWMSRYAERAEHVARVLMVNINSLLDVGDLDPIVERHLWNGPLKIFLLDQAPEARELLALPRESMAAQISHYLVFDPNNPNSIHACITRARENARSIRENISAEMWENLNTLYWSLRADDATARFEESATDVLKQITNAALLFQGLTDQTLYHGQPWQFIQLGKHLERIEVTCRIIESKFETLRLVESEFEHTERNMHLLSVVRSCCALEAFRRSAAEIEPETISAFLILERHFPRSVCYAARHAHDAVSRISHEVSPVHLDPAEGILGRLTAELTYAQPEDIAVTGLSTYLQRIQSATLAASMALKKSYFLQ
jgi:uncharacterized alpha-E superfamily protein